MTGEEMINQMIERVRALDGNVVDEVARDLVPVIEAEIRRTMKAGTTAYGEKWAPRKIGSAPVLVDAADALRVAAVGGRVFVRLTGPEARHHRGINKGGKARPMIPIGGIPSRMRDRVADKLAEVFVRLTQPEGGS